MQTLAAEALVEDLVAISIRDDLIDTFLNCSTFIRMSLSFLFGLAMLPALWKLAEDKTAAVRVRELAIECLTVVHVLQLGSLEERF